MNWVIRRAVLLLVPIAWGWYRSRRRAQRDRERRRAVRDEPERGAPPG